MQDAGSESLARWMRAMRSALACAELAASELSRESATPRVRQLALSVSQAISDADHLVARLSRRPEVATGGSARVALASVLTLLRARLAPSLEARDILWLCPADRDEGVIGDPVLLRRAGVAMLRAGAALLPEGGTLTLDARAEPEGWRLELGLERRAASEAAELLETAAEVLGAVASRFAAGFACCPTGNGPAITAALSFLARESSCNAC
ncbi:MAG: hypothetical protein M5U32_03150 [Myxococcota bacterium]|nr:hypothetical protein [Myxococcota bacterium]